MPKLLRARVPEDPAEESKIRKLAGSRHAPGEWIFRARIVSLSWQGLRTARIAEELGCHPKTVRKRLHRFNAQGIDGLGDRPGAGRKPRITEDGRSRIIALVSEDPPGKLLRHESLPPEALDEAKAAYWTLYALAEVAQEMGIEVGRSQVRRILLREVCAGATPGRVPKVRTRSSSQKVEDRRTLHEPATELHGGLRRRARTHHPAVLPSGPGMVA